VVTNAETGWVQLSCQKFIPLVLPMLNKLTILSARSTYEAMFPDSPLKWSVLPSASTRSRPRPLTACLTNRVPLGNSFLTLLGFFVSVSLELPMRV